MFWKTCLFLLTSVALHAQVAANADARLKSLEDATRAAQSSGDNAWMLVCSALVLLMTGPGLALFYGGLVRKKNVLATMMQSFAMMALITVLWAIIGYSLCFASGSSFLGGLEHAFLHGVGAAPNADYAATIPQQTFMIYQLMFAIITPALISGAFAERMKFCAMLLLHDAVDAGGLLPHGAHGVGQGRAAERVAGRPHPVPRLRRRHGGAHHFRAFRRWSARCTWASAWATREADEAAQPGAQRHRRLPAVGGLVRLQRRQRAERLRPGHQRLRRDALRRGRGRAGLDAAPNGCTTASPACWAPSPAASPVWSPSRPRPGFVQPMPALAHRLAAPACSASSWSPS